MQAAPPRWPTAARWSSARSASGGAGAITARLPTAKFAAGTTPAHPASSSSGPNTSNGPPSHQTGPASVTTSPGSLASASRAPKTSARSLGSNRGCSGSRQSTVLESSRWRSTSAGMVNPGLRSHHWACITGSAGGSSPFSSITSGVRSPQARLSSRPTSGSNLSVRTVSRRQSPHPSGAAWPTSTRTLRPRHLGPRIAATEPAAV